MNLYCNTLSDEVLTSLLKTTLEGVGYVRSYCCESYGKYLIINPISHKFYFSGTNQGCLVITIEDILNKFLPIPKAKSIKCINLKKQIVYFDNGKEMSVSSILKRIKV